MYFANEESKIYIMHPVGGEHHAAALRWYDYISPSAFAKHDVSAKADILYLVILGIMYLASARHFYNEVWHIIKDATFSC